MTQFIIRVYDVMEHAFKLNQIQNLNVQLKIIKLRTCHTSQVVFLKETTEDLLVFVKNSYEKLRTIWYQL